MPLNRHPFARFRGKSREAIDLAMKRGYLVAPANLGRSRDRIISAWAAWRTVEQRKPAVMVYKMPTRAYVWTECPSGYELPEGAFREFCAIIRSELLRGKATVMSGGYSNVTVALAAAEPLAMVLHDFLLEYLQVTAQEECRQRRAQGLPIDWED